MAKDHNKQENASKLDAVTTVLPLLRTTSVNGSTVDTQGYESVLFVSHVGTITDGTHTLSIEESANDSDWSAADSDDLFGTGLTTAALKEPAWTSAADDRVHEVAYVGKERYVRAVITVSGGPATGGTIGVVALRGHARHEPAGATQLP